MSDKKNQALFSIIFEDESNFVGGNSYYETKWLDVPDKKIKRIFYKLPNGDYLLLDRYEKYYQYVEVTQDWMRIHKGQVTPINASPIIEYAYIMGKKGKKVISYRIKLRQKKDDKFKIGDITIREFNINDKKITGLHPEGWK